MRIREGCILTATNSSDERVKSLIGCKGALHVVNGEPLRFVVGTGDFLKGQTKRYVKLLKTNHQYHQFVFCNVKEADHAFAALHPETAWGQMANDEMLAFFYRCAR